MRIVLIDTAFLGDLVLATPLVRAAAEQAASGTIDVVTSAAGARILRDNPCVSDLFFFDKRRTGRGLGGMRAARDWIRERRPDLALLPRRSIRSMLLAALAGVPRRIGFPRGPSRWLLTDTVPFDSGLHQVDRNLELLRPLGVNPATSGKEGHPLEIFPSAEDRRDVDTWLQKHGLTRAGSFHALAPGSNWATKRWPLERYAAVAAALAGDRPVVVVGGPAEGEMIRRLIQEVPGPQRGAVLDAADIFSPAAMMYLLTRATVLISNDSGALHLGQAAGIPVVAIFGPTAPSQGFAPRGDRHVVVQEQDLACRPCGRHGAARCPEEHWRCMLDLPVNRVLAAVESIRQTGAW
jgi:heptosyltransferase-2